MMHRNHLYWDDFPSNGGMLRTTDLAAIRACDLYTAGPCVFSRPNVSSSSSSSRNSVRASNRRLISGAGAGCTMAPNGSGKKYNARQPPEELVKRVRTHNAYELSQELLDKQIELLERKYGGHARAHNAARVIQRAYRHYSMRKKFATITAMAKAEKRFARRLNSAMGSTLLQTNFESSWTAVAQQQQQLKALEGNAIGEYTIRSNLASHYRQSEQTSDGYRLPRASSARQTMRAAPQQHFSYSSSSHYSVSSQSHYSHQQAYYHCEAQFSAAAHFVSQQQLPVVSVQRRSSDVRHLPAPPRQQLPRQPKKVPPQVPRRTCSVLTTNPVSRPVVTISGPAENSRSPQQHESQNSARLSQHSTSEDSLEGVGYTTLWSDGKSSASSSRINSSPASTGDRQQHSATDKVPDAVRKRQYRVGLNLFNKKPERGISHLIQTGFLENSPRAVAKFLMTRKGVSKQMIGEFLGNLQNPFNIATLNCFFEEMDFTGMDIDVALRKFQTHFRMPGEAQKIERLMEVFGSRYCQCNPDVAARLRNPDTVFILAFAIIMLNTDLHTPCMKEEKRMKLEDFIKNLRGVDDGSDIDRDLLVGIYERVKANEFKAGLDHVTQVFEVQQSIVGKKPNLVQPHRRLVSYCRFYEVADMTKRERAGLHQREVFLFNDLLLVTKIFNKKKNNVTYTFRQSFPLAGLAITFFETPYYQFGVRISQRVDNTVIIMFNARNEHDRTKFSNDLREAILETDEMESLRIETELEKQRNNARAPRPARDKTENRDSGVGDMDPSSSTSLNEAAAFQGTGSAAALPDPTLKRTTLSNSLLDIHEPFDRYQRRNSVGSLDSGMSISYQSTTTNSTVSRDSSPKNRGVQQQVSSLSGILHRRDHPRRLGILPEPAKQSVVAHTTDV